MMKELKRSPRCVSLSLAQRLEAGGTVSLAPSERKKSSLHLTDSRVNYMHLV